MFFFYYLSYMVDEVVSLEKKKTYYSYMHTEKKKYTNIFES